jgi:hypothetical protein
MQPPAHQQMPMLPKKTGVDRLPLGDKLMLDIYFKQNFDLNTQFAKEGGRRYKLQGNVYDGFTAFDENEGKIVWQTPPTMQKYGRMPVQTETGAEYNILAPTQVNVPVGGGAPGGGLGSTPPALGAPIRTKPDEITWQKVGIPGGGEGIQPLPKAQAGMPAIQTEPPKGESATEAGRLQLAQSGMQAFDELNNMVFDKKGNINYKTLGMGVAGGIPWTEGRRIEGLLYRAADAIIRGATGAQMPESEWKNYQKMYAPSAFDDERTIRVKMNGMINYLNGYLEKMDPTGAKRLRVGEFKMTPENTRGVEVKPGAESVTTPNYRYNPATGKLEATQ